MGFFDRLFKPKEPPEPPGKGDGPDFVAPPDNPPIPYLPANYTYSPPSSTKLHQEGLAAGKEYKEIEGPPERWTGNNPYQRTELWPQEHLTGDEGKAAYVPRKTLAKDPRETPPEYSGAMGQGSRSPVGYVFTRPFDIAGGAKHLNGNRFSQSEHPHDYPFTGITSSGMKRNTFRVDPAPWDADVVDRPTGGDSTVEATYSTPVTLPRRQTSYRLGG